MDVDIEKDKQDLTNSSERQKIGSNDRRICQTKTIKSLFHCSICGLGTESEDNLKEHQVTKHSHWHSPIAPFAAE